MTTRALFNYSAGSAHLFSFPFWLFVDRTNAFATGTLTWNSECVRVYPPFRSGPANFSPMPAINVAAIPFEPGVVPRQQLPIFKVTTMPLLKAAGGPGVTTYWSTRWVVVPEIFPMDSLRIDVLSREATSFDLQGFVRQLLEHIRVATRQWWVLRSSDALLRYQRAAFQILQNGSAAGSNPRNVEHCRLPFGFEGALSNLVWMNSVESAIRGISVPIHELSLLDAFYFVAAEDFRAAIMQAAAALEQGIEARCAILWQRKYGKEFRRGHLKSNRATRHVSVEMQRHFGRSFAVEFPKTFQELENLWGARNNVAHGGKPEIRRGTNVIAVDDAVGERMVRAVRTCLKWMSSV